MKHNDSLIAMRDILNKVIERMEGKDGDGLREDSQNVREFVLNDVMRDFKPRIQQSQESVGRLFTEEDTKKARDLILKAAQAGDLEACKYILEYQVPEMDPEEDVDYGVLFDW